MSMNARLEAQKRKMEEALFTPAYKVEEERYFEVLEEELRKETGWCGWIDYENPIDILYAAIENEDEAFVIADFLASYLRFQQILTRVYGHPCESEEDIALVAKAEEIIARKANGGANNEK